MTAPIERPGGMVKWNTNQRLDSDDLINTGSMPLQTLCDFLLARFFGVELAGAPNSAFFGDDCKVTVVSGLNVEVAAGQGLFLDAAESDEFEPIYQPIVVPAALSQAVNAHHATLPRIDILSLAPAYDDDVADSRQLFDGIDTLNPVTVDTRRRLHHTMTYTAGTPGANPTAPATPSGHVRLCEIYVPGTSGALVITDLRYVLRPAQSTLNFHADHHAPFIPGAYTGGSGYFVVAATFPNSMAFYVAPGRYQFNGYEYQFPERVLVTLDDADGSDDRIDVIYVDVSGVDVATGTPAGSPTAPSIPISAVAIAHVLVEAGVLTVDDGDVTDKRPREPYTGAQIRAASVENKRLTSLYVVPDLSAAAQVSETRTVTIETKDWDGESIEEAVIYRVEVRNVDMVVPDPVGEFKVEVGGTGSWISDNSSPVPELLALSAANGVLEIDVTHGFSGAGTALLIVTPLNRPGCPTHTPLVFT